ncbi:MAG TPA: hypothetical protein VM050_09830 [Patescibacteria group bacterium]|nr:hypothetical protein [Patescibacteria group bacterium]
MKKRASCAFATLLIALLAVPVYARRVEFYVAHGSIDGYVEV